MSRLDLEGAISWAANAHRGQQYGHGPYILHPLRVMAAVSEFSAIAAVLHDVMEDTTAGLPPGIEDVHAEAVSVLTRRKDDETYDEYIERVLWAEGLAGEVAREVKSADLLDHLTHMTHGKLHLVRRYRGALDKLGWLLEDDHVQSCRFCGQEYGYGECCPDCAQKCSCPWSMGMGPNTRCPIHGWPQYRLPLFKGMH